MNEGAEPAVLGPVGETRVLRNLLGFGIPLVLGMGFHALFNLVDLFMVGKYGTEALAAVTIATMINTVPMVICNGISTSSIAFIARNIGFGNLHRANDVLRQSFLLVVGLSIVFGVLPYIYARELVVFLQAKGPAVTEQARTYLEVASLGTITMFVLMQITAALRAAGDGLWPMILLVGANLLNVVLDYALIFGEWGCPRLGAPGAAWATVIARGVFCIVGLAVLVRGKAGLRLNFPRFRIRLRIMWDLVRVGMPTSIQWVVRIVSYLALLWIVGDHDPDLRPDFGQTAQAAFGVGLRLDLLAIFCAFGWGAAASTLVGQNLGRGRPDLASRSSWTATWLNVLMMVLIGAAYFVFASFLIRFFGVDKSILEAGPESARPGAFDDVVRVGATYLRVTVFSYVFVAVALTLAQALNGAGSTRPPMVIDLIGLIFVQLPLAYYLSRNESFGLRGVWYSIVISSILMAVLYVLWFRVGRWKRKELW